MSWTKELKTKASAFFTLEALSTRSHCYVCYVVNCYEHSWDADMNVLA